jgi:hypothetical protein
VREPAFDQNPIGIDYDPAKLVKEFKARVAELIARVDC